MTFDLAAIMQAAKRKELTNAPAPAPAPAPTQIATPTAAQLPSQTAAPVIIPVVNTQAQSTSLSLSDEEVQLLSMFRTNLNHLSASLADPRYEIKPHDAIRTVGDIIRNNPNLASILEPQDFQLIVRNTRATAQQRANAVSATQVKREEKADLKRQASALLDDALAGQFSGAMGPIKSTTPAAAKSAISGDAFASMMKDFAKGNTSAPAPAPVSAPATSPPKPAPQSLSALFGKKKD